MPACGKVLAANESEFWSPRPRRKRRCLLRVRDGGFIAAGRADKVLHWNRVLRGMDILSMPKTLPKGRDARRNGKGLHAITF